MPAADRAVLHPQPQLRNRPAAAAARRIVSLDCLTETERFVLLWFIIIPDKKAIAASTGRRPQTIRNHLASAIHKLQVRTQGGLLIFLYSGERLWLSS
jgi:DNA-binding CsgD family transcriptional regulator